ncbi:MAG TPA: hypothetical protein VE985_06245 [Gaiellaceae bacterium]|nr:hypothetical protein [Gaiellaceae bacterium]
MLRLLTASGVCILATGGGLAVAATGVSIPALGLNVSAPPEKAAALQRLESVATTDSSPVPAGPPEPAPRPIPARMLGSGAPVPISPSILQVRNGWLVSNGRTLVAVYAGAAGNDPAVGRVVIVRQDLAAGSQTVRTIDAGQTGALTIAEAPLGSAVETSAQTDDLRLRGADGRALRLDLGTSSVGGR